MRAWVLVALGALGFSGLRAEALAESAPALEAAVERAEAVVSRGEPPAGGAVIHWEAARGEREPALVVVRAARDGLVSARATALFSSDGAALPASAVELDRVQWVAHGGRELPDRLDPLSGPTPASASENLLLWVEVAVPRSAAPGFYHGALELSQGRAVRSLPIDLHVLPFSLPATPSLATSFNLGEQSGPVGAFARMALQEKVTYRLAQPPPFTVTPLEGTLKLDFRGFDRDLDALLQDGARPSSIAIEVPRQVPAPRRLEYLLAVKRHLADRGCGELLVNFDADESLLRHVQGAPDRPVIALVAARDDGPRHGPFWWRLGGAGASRALSANAAGAVDVDESGAWLSVGARPWQVRSIGWAAFHAGAAGLFSPAATPLLYEANDGSPRESVRLKLLRQGIEDYELLQLASRVDPVRVRQLAESVLDGEGAPTAKPVDFEQPRSELIRMLQGHHARRTVRVP